MMMFAAKGKAASLLGQAVDLAGWLGLAAAPTFALMAWISAVSSPGMTMCSAASAFMPINDMALMYLLMSLFHASPWLKVFPARSQHRNTSANQTEGD
jgi:glycerol-3-phosphate acyltransferase PlsY